MDVDEPIFEAALYGTVMRGMPHHSRIAGAAYVRDELTAPRYRLLTVGGEYPLMVEDREHGRAIAVQIFSLTASIWRGKVDKEPSGLLEGHVALRDGRTVAIMLGDPAWIAVRDDVEDITRYGGWAAFQETRLTEDWSEEEDNASIPEGN